MNKSVMKCCICNNENIGEFITIKDEKYHLCCIEELQQENKELKKQLEESKNDLDDLFNQKQFYFKNMQLNQLETCKMKHQQKEFINWLEENYKTTQDIWYVKILNKFKEIIGVEDD